jgi:hypothetical protein
MIPADLLPTGDTPRAGYQNRLTPAWRFLAVRPSSCLFPVVSSTCCWAEVQTHYCDTRCCCCFLHGFRHDRRGPRRCAGITKFACVGFGWGVDCVWPLALTGAVDAWALIHGSLHRSFVTRVRVPGILHVR